MENNAKNEKAIKNHFTKRIGKTTYKVTVYFSDETLAADFHAVLSHHSSSRLLGFNFIRYYQRKDDFLFADFLEDIA